MNREERERARARQERIRTLRMKMVELTEEIGKYPNGKALILSGLVEKRIEVAAELKILLEEDGAPPGRTS